MELETKTDAEKSELFSSVEKLKPAFASNEAAIQFFSKKLEAFLAWKACKGGS